MVFSRRRLLRTTGGLGLGAFTHAALAGRSLVNPQAAEATMSLNMQLDWKFNVQFAGLMLAAAAGLYTEKGLAVELMPWESGLVVTDAVIENPMTLGCAEQNLILDAQAAGAPIRAIATMFQASPLALMALPDSGITRLRDLVDQKVGVHADGLAVMALVQGVSGLEENAIAVTEIPYEAKAERLLSGEYAAIQCYAIDEPIGFAAETGIEPVVISLNDYGYEAYAQVIFAHAELLANTPMLVQDFLTATFAGWRLALADIPAAAERVVSTYVEADSPYADLDYQTQSLALIADYLLLDIEPSQLGSISPGRWMRMARRFADYRLIAQVPELTHSLALSSWTER
ncbi:ABC transporter substrate-binding protein [Romeria aff. gracilis LEGE 07310]|uniref:Thiamine pyrimidine synthase n=1 Tax=Vasconcelosia minhoensis LEGE 07310 TaxID=915328 RepID=A0A8J7A7Q1_9CYAN|nr:ABC transporter substrate-binding protein [Romeria gracilis]MBE9078527.1 ABC transporter substrate-binding protein [Romeria aff. gracilis LEGE 07310]